MIGFLLTFGAILIPGVGFGADSYSNSCPAGFEKLIQPGGAQAATELANLVKKNIVIRAPLEPMTPGNWKGISSKKSLWNVLLPKKGEGKIQYFVDDKDRIFFRGRMFRSLTINRSWLATPARTE
jgi:hypothetical protein